MADQLAVMSEGRLEQIGTPREIFDRPKTDFVASFVGQLVPCRHRRGPSRAEIRGSVSCIFPGAIPVRAKARFFWCEPHHFVLGEGVNVFSGIVEHVTYRGQMLTLGVRAGDYRRRPICPLPTLPHCRPRASA